MATDILTKLSHTGGMPYRRLLIPLLSLLSACSPAYDRSDARFEAGGFEKTGVVRVERPEAPALAEATGGTMRAGDQLIVGSWNIQWLDSPNERKGNRAQRPEELAEYIAASQVDILAVQEIGAAIAEGVWRSNTLERVVEILTERGRGAWRYMLFPNADDDLGQLTGVMWNGDRVQMLGWRPANINRSRYSELWQRHPVAVKFSAGAGLTDLLVTPIHMRCCLDAHLRHQEAVALVEAIPELLKSLGDWDLLLIGDANMWRHDERAGEVYRKAGLEDLNKEDRSTHIRKVPLDRAFVVLQDGQRDEEFARSEMEVFGRSYAEAKGLKAKEFGERYSDHFLIRLPVTVMADDD